MHGSFPSISVVIPAYNVEKYVEEAVDSVINQTVPFTEIVIVNDGSTDNTAQKISKYEAYDNVNIIHTKNQGVGQARNEGIQASTGDYIYFFDSDDILEPHFVQTMSDAINNDGPLDLIFFSGANFYEFGSDEKGDDTDDQYIRKIEGNFACGLDAFSALMEVDNFCPSPWIYVSKRKIWENGLRFMPIIHEDDEVIVKLTAEAGPTKIIKDALYRRRVRPGSIMTSAVSRKYSIGYFHAYLATLEVYRNVDCKRHKDMLKKRLKDISWMYLNECECGGVNPNYYETAFMTMHSQAHRSMLLKLLLPSWLMSYVIAIKN